MSTSLKVQRDIIALEAFSIKETVSILKRVFPDMVATIKEKIGAFSSNSPAIALTRDEKAFLQLIEKQAFLQIASLTVPTVPGLSTTYQVYGDKLLAVARHAAQILTVILNPFSSYLALLINDASQKFDTSDFATQLRTYGETREKLLTELTAQIKGTAVRAPLDQVVHRNADWKPALIQAHDITTAINSVDRQGINRKAAEITALLDTLLRKLRDKELEGVSPQVTESLAEGVYQTANELEYFSAVYFMVQEYITSLDQAMDELTTKLR